ncbi:hypothetical protein RDABS01_033466 [Bienertia sinuspersici]
MNAPCETFGELLVWAKKNLDHEKLVIFATLSWSAWSCRNKAIFDNITPNATVIAQGLINFVLGWVECSWKCAVPIARRVNVVSVSEWHKPHEGWLKVNVDVHISDEGFVGAGAVVRDCDGVITLAAVRRRKSRWEPKLGELYAIRFGLQLAHRFNFSKIIVETDSLEVAQKIAVSSSGKSQFHLLLDDVLYYSNLFESCVFNHVKRGGNCLAHLVAREFTEIGTERVWMNSIPQSFCNVARLDLIQ